MKECGAAAAGVVRTVAVSPVSPGTWGCAMPTETVMRTVGLLAGMYLAGLVVTLISLASLEAAGFNLSMPMCTPGECRSAVVLHHAPPLGPATADAGREPSVLATAALYMAKF